MVAPGAAVALLDRLLGDALKASVLVGFGRCTMRVVALGTMRVMGRLQHFPMLNVLPSCGDLQRFSDQGNNNDNE